MAGKFQRYWSPVRNVAIPFAADEVWQSTQDIDSFRAGAGAKLTIPTPDHAGTLELSTVYLNADNELVPPAQNARLTIQLVEGVIMGDLPIDQGDLAKPNAAIPILVPPMLVNVGSSVEIRGEDTLATSTPFRGLMLLGFQTLTLVSPPVGATKVLLLARYS